MSGASSTPLITVITPAYNVETFIAEAVESVLAQTERRFEYLIVDDESSDATAAAAANAAGNDERVRILSRKHGGSGAARNTALRMASGKYIAFLDGDDRWHPAKLQRQLQHLASAPSEVGGVFCWSRLISEHGQVVGVQTSRPGTYDLDRFLESFAPTRNGSSMLLKRRTFDEAGEFDESLFSNVDYDMWLRIGQTNTSPLLVSQPTVQVDYRLRHGSIVHDVAAHSATLERVLDAHSPAMKRLPSGAAYVKPALFAYARGDEKSANRLAVKAETAGYRYLLRRPAGRNLLFRRAMGPTARRVVYRTKTNFYDVIKKVLRANAGRTLK